MSINLLPWREQQARSKTIVFYSILLTCCMISMAGIGYLIPYFRNKIYVQEFRNHYLITQIASIKTPRNYRKRLENFKKLQQRIQFIIKKIKQHGNLMDLIRQIGTAMPDDLHLTLFSKNKQQITLQGTAKNSEAITRFIKMLSKNTKLLNIKPSNIRSDNTWGGTEFTVEATIPLANEDTKLRHASLRGA